MHQSLYNIHHGDNKVYTIVIGLEKEATSCTDFKVGLVILPMVSDSGIPQLHRQLTKKVCHALKPFLPARKP